MNDTELFELCKEVYRRTGWNRTEFLFAAEPGTEDYKIIHKSELHRLNDSVYFEDKIYNSTFCYDTDYLLEKLASNYSIEATVRYVSHNTQDALYRYMTDKLGKFVAFTPDMAMGKYPTGDKPVIPLLKLVIALDDAGELKS